MRIASVGHAVLAATLIGLGVQGLVSHEFSVIWQPVSRSVPAREALLYLCPLIFIGSGIGLLFARSAAIAARVLLGSLLFWLLLLRLPPLLLSPSVETSWSAAEASAMVAAAWVLYVWFAADSGTSRFALAGGERGLRIAHVLYGLALIPFGIAHFAYLKHTADDVPGWMPWHYFWAILFGWTFIAAGVGVLIGVYARLAAALSAFQMGLFFALVWIPIVLAGTKDAFQWTETVGSLALLAGAWVVADSYRGTPWLASRTNL